MPWCISARPCQLAGPGVEGPPPEGGNGRNGMMASEKLFGLHATALQLRSQRMMMLASNIANAATPNYKARDIDFAKALDLAPQGASTEGAISYPDRKSALEGKSGSVGVDVGGCRNIKK